MSVSELKSDPGRVRPEQEQWIATRETFPGVPCGIVQPREMSRVPAILAAAIWDEAA